MIGILMNLRGSAIALLLTNVLLLNNLIGQTSEPCGLDYMTKKYYLEHPDKVQSIEQTRIKLESQIDAQQSISAKTGVVYTIPVVVHVLHEFGSENISDAQIHDAIAVINADFNMLNGDISQVVSSFQGIIGDAEIEFQLAQKDPNGNCTNGIDRIVTPLTTGAHDNAKLNQWAPNKYLNIWVVKSIDNGGSGGIVAGYAYFPFLAANDPTVDGVMVAHNYFGSIGTAQNEDGRTLTHEVGHYLNCYHPWGNLYSIGDQQACNDPDGDWVSDTPKTIGSNSSCNTSSTTCGTLDNVQNYMDYATCTRMFTAGQVSRMRTALTSGVASRSNLWSSSNLTATGTDGNNNLCEADFEVDYKNVCSGGTVNFTDLSYHGQNSWNWSFSIGTPSSTTTQNPSLTINDLGYVDVSLTVGDGSTSITGSKNGFMRAHSAIGKYIPASEGFEGASIPNFSWEIENYPEDSRKWEQYFGASSSGSACIYLNNNGSTEGSIDEFISETYDLSVLSSGAITFDYAYAQVTGSEQDRLTIFISTDCGQTWNTRGVLIGSNMTTGGSNSSNYIPSSSEWATETVNLFAPDLDEGFMVKFSFLSDAGNNIFIDNILIDGTFDQDPVLHLPHDGELNVADNVIIDWRAVKDVDQYEYEIDDSPGFNSGNVITGTTNYISPDPSNADTRFQTSGLTHGQKYWWRVRTVTGGTSSSWSDTWDFTVSASGVGITELNESFETKIFPNPSFLESNLQIELRRTGRLKVQIYDALGKLIETIWSNKLLNAGEHNLRINTKNLNSGVYYVVIENNSKSERLKLLVE
jgi:PKD repeat protein